jgi:hypothetical protein
MAKRSGRQPGNLQLMDGEWCADSIFKAMRKPIWPVTDFG